MTDKEFIQPILKFFEWYRTYHIVIAEHSFSLFEIDLFILIATILIWFISFIAED